MSRKYPTQIKQVLKCRCGIIDSNEQIITLKNVHNLIGTKIAYIFLIFPLHHYKSFKIT